LKELGSGAEYFARYFLNSGADQPCSCRPTARQ